MRYERLNRLIERLLDREGLSPEETARLQSRLVITVDGSEIPFEDLFVTNRRAWLGSHQLAAGGAGFRTQVGISNESTVADAGITFLRGAYIWSNTGASQFGVRYHTSAAAFAGGGITFLRDGQWFGTGTTGVPRFTQCRSQNTAAAIGGIGPVVGTAPASTALLIKWYDLILPNQSRLFDPLVDNVAMSGSFWGEEWEIKARG